MPVEKITPESTFQELGIDSMDGINILFALENEFNINIPDEAAREVRGIKDLVDGVERLLQSAGS
jgi:acyl carrier protein